MLYAYVSQRLQCCSAYVDDGNLRSVFMIWHVLCQLGAFRIFKEHNAICLSKTNESKVSVLTGTRTIYFIQLGLLALCRRDDR
jgi:hypothetical protein